MLFIRGSQHQGHQPISETPDQEIVFLTLSDIIQDIVSWVRGAQKKMGSACGTDGRRPPAKNRNEKPS